MRNINEVIDTLIDAGVHVYLDDGKLKTKSFKGALSPPLVELIKNNKDQIIAQISKLDSQPSAAIERTTIKKGDINNNQSPASHAQQRLWFIDQMDGNSVHYNMPYVLEVKGHFNVGVAEQAFRQIIQRHEALRTVFKTGEHAPWQVIQSQFDFTISEQDFSARPEAIRLSLVEAAIEKDAGLAFDLSADLMIRVSCLHLKQQHCLLLLNFHHIAFDGWSMGVLVNEFVALYSAYQNDGQNPLAELDIQYADYAAWQHQWLDGPVLDQQLNYWSEQLADLPQVHDLPLDFHRPQHPSNEGALQHFSIDADTLSVLKTVALDNQATLFMLVHAVFSVLLARFSNNPDVVIGTPVANRQQKQTEPLIGFFANTLVLRTDCDLQLKFSDYLKQVQQTHLAAQANQDVPFEYLVDRLSPNRSTSHSALFQILLMMDGDQIPNIDLAGIKISKRHSDHVPIKFELTLNVSEVDGALKGIFQYNTDLFKANSVQRLAAGFQTLCQSIAHDSHALVGRLALLSDAETHYLLHELNQQQLSYPHDWCIHHLFEQQVDKTPDGTALVFADQTCSFTTLNQQANQLAWHLIELQQAAVATEHTVIGLCMERSIDMVVGLLAILKSGSAYLPIDPSYPPERIKHMLLDSGMSLLLTQRVWHSVTQEQGITALAIDDPSLKAQCAQYPVTNPSVDGLTPNDLAYVIYTSGSTGVPKGVLQTHRTLVNLVHAQGSQGGLSQPIRTLQFAPFNFDVSIQELCTSWFTGSPLVMISQQAKDDLTQLPRLLKDLHIERAFLPPAVLNWLTDDLLKQQMDLPALQELIVAGEALVVSSALQKYLQQHPNVQLWNHYGPTETHVATVASVNVKQNNTSQPIGHVLPNLTAYVLDELQQPVPKGAVGQLHIGGDGLAQGYLNQTELTEQNFISNPFGSNADDLIYRTGDWVRYLEDGQLEFIGRMDDQIKIRGFRIELGEVEQQLNNLASVQSAVVMVHTSSNSQQRLVAYVCATEKGSTMDFIAQLKASLGRSLPDYMLPEVFMVVEEFTLTANGKVNRKALPEPDAALFNTVYVAPSGELEISLMEIWSQLLKVPEAQISAAANFFELGGHSLLTVKLITEVRARLRVELSIRNVFESPILSQLARLIEEAGHSDMPEMVAVDRDSNILEPSYAQQRLWFIDQMEGGSQHYNMTGCLRVEGDFDVKLAEQAFAQIIRRHEPLRTVFTEQENRPHQLIQDQFEFELRVIDLSNSKGAQQEQSTNSQISQINDLSFDLSRDLMLRVHYLYLNDQQGVLIISVHHIAFDGWSIAILMNEFSQNYQNLKNNQSTQLPPLAIQYADYAHWQRQWLAGEAIEKQLSYWEKQLADLPQVHNLPLDYERPKFQSFKGKLLHFNANSEVLKGLKSLALEQQSTLFMVVHAVFAVLLSRHSNNSDIVVGTPVANRLQKPLESLIGFFVNNLVLRADCSHNPTFTGFLQHIKQTHLDAQANQEVPFEQLVDRLNPARNTSFDALFQIMICMNNNDQYTMTLPGVGLSTQTNDHVTAKYDLTLYVSEADNLEFTFEYNTDLFTDVHIKELAEALICLMQAVVTDANTAINVLPMLSEQQKQHLLIDLNNTLGPYPDDVCMHQLFEHQVKQTPNNIALVYKDQSLTYQQLNQRANQLAHLLISQGVGADDLVGLCLERSIEMMTGILAIMKAGAAYLPLDPSYPVNRLEYMLDDSGLKVLLTQRQFKQLTQSLLTDQHVQFVLNDESLVQQLQQLPTSNPVIEGLHERNLAYAIYTSGSTGQPKGVLVEHQALLNRIDWMQKTYHLDEQDVLLQKTPFSFDVSVWEFTWYFTAGARLVMAEAEGHKDPQYLTDLIQQQQVTTLHFVPSMLRSMLTNPEWARCHSLQRVFCSGEALPADLPPLHYRLNSAGLHNLYGPTEAAIDVSFWPVPNDEILSVVPIGKPIQNIQLLILNEQLQLQPKGSPGELFIAGVGLARGYLNQPVLTEQRFIKHPFTEGGSTRLYRTGDLVKYLPDGNIAFIGRVDHQVKLRGFRIELGEIDHQLTQQTLVDAAVTVLREDNPGHQQLVAYYTTNSTADEAIVTEQLRQDLQAELPEYMVPNQLIRLAIMPLSANGKIDRKALPKPELSLEVDSYTKPTGAVEESLVQIWSELLNIPQHELGVTSNFFSLGGDSILSIQLVSRAVSKGLKLSVKQLFEYQTIRDLAPHVAQNSAVMISQKTTIGEQLLLPIQLAFFNDEMAVNHYNQALIYRSPNDIDKGLLAAMLTQLFARHDVLRLRFHKNANNWQTSYVPFSDTMVQQAIGLIDLNQPGFDALAEHANPYQQSLSITDGPLFRAIICRDVNQETRLLLIFHHLIMDGVSWRILRDDIEQLYRQQQQNQTMKLASKTNSYQDWAQMIQHDSQSEALIAEKSYWLKVLEHTCPALPKTSQMKEGYAQLECSLDAVMTEQLLNKAPTSYRTHINELLLSALLLAVHQWTGQRAVKVDLEGHGRDAQSGDFDLSQTIGWFTVIYPVVLASESMQPGALICAIKEAQRRIPNNGMGFGILKYINNGFKNTHDKSFEFPILFNYLGRFDDFVDEDQLFTMSDENVGQSVNIKRVPMHDIIFNGAVINQCLSFRIDYNQSKHDETQMSTFLNHLIVALTSLIKHCVEPTSGYLTPADFPLAHIEQPALSQWQQRYKIKDIYPSTAMQQGLLYHSEIDSSAYVSQLILTFETVVDFVALQHAWQLVLNRHSVFKTCFVTNEEGETLQLLTEDVTVPWLAVDLAQLSEIDQVNTIAQYRQADKSLGFNIDEAPLFRVQLWHLAKNHHKMMISNHHALLDGWSFSVVFKEVLHVYRALQHNQSPNLKPATDFRHYIHWLGKQNTQQAKQFWQQQLADVTGASHLSQPQLAFAATGPNEVKEKVENRSFNAHQTTALEQVAQQCQVTVNTLLQAAWSYLLSRYCDSETVVFGTTVAGRPAELDQVEDMVGLFINTIPVITTVEPNMRLHDWFKLLHQQQINRNEFSFLPLVEIQALSSFQHNEALLGSLFVFENYPIEEAAFSSKTDASLNVSHFEVFEEANFNLSVMAAVLDGCLNLKLSGKSSHFTELQMGQIAQHLSVVITQLLNSDDQTQLGALQLLTDQEQHQLLHVLNDTTKPYEHQLCIHQKFEQQVASTPDHVAVVYQDQSLTYTALNDKANQLAHYLIQHGGIKPDQFVGLCVERSLDMMVGLIAILKAGAAYLPLDPSYPKARLDHMLQDSDVGLILTQSELLEITLKEGATQVVLDDPNWQSQLNQFSTTNPEVISLTSNHLAYLIYTSGSTGQPKGVMLEHHGAINLAMAQIEHFSVNPASRVLQFASINFDAATSEWMMALLVGATLHIAPQSIRSNPAALSEYLHQQHITHVTLPPAVLQYLDEEKSYDLQALIVAGEAFDQQLSNRWAVKYPFFNAYGPSESTVCATMSAPIQVDQLNMGKAMNNTRLYILDRAQLLVPDGAVGELYVAGAGLARGYLNQPQLTEDRFIQHTFTDGTTERLYRTGDLVQYTEHHDLLFMGRTDDQIKIRGFRVELAEIEQQLSSHDAVHAALVVVDNQSGEQQTGDKRLVAYVATGDNALPELTEVLRDHLKQHLPDYMVPTVLMQMAAFPLTANGKIDRKALPVPAVDLTHNYQTPQGKTQLTIMQIWAQLLKLPADKISANANFFELGGHSLLAVKLMTKINSELGVQLKIDALFEAKNLISLAAHVDMLSGNKASDSASDQQEMEHFEI